MRMRARMLGMRTAGLCSEEVAGGGGGERWRWVEDGMVFWWVV